jgi:hypothetical protein
VAFKKNKHIKQRLLLLLGKEAIYNLWISDFKYIVEFIFKYRPPVDQPAADEVYFLITTWGIYIYYLLLEDESYFSKNKKQILLEEISKLQLDLKPLPTRKFSELLEEALKYVWGIASFLQKPLNERIKSLDEIIDQYKESVLKDWEIPPEVGMKKLIMSKAIELFFLFTLIELIPNWIIDYILEKSQKLYYILKLISIIDLYSELGIPNDLKKYFNKYQTLLGISIKLENFKNKLKILLRKGLRRLMELYLNELLEAPNSEVVRSELDFWKSRCEKVIESCEEKYVSSNEIYPMRYLMLLSDLRHKTIKEFFLPKEECLQLNICKLNLIQCKEIFLKNIIAKDKTIKTLSNMLNEILEDLLMKNDKFNENFKKWCEKERILIFYFL